MDKLTVLDLFSGIGGFSLGLERTGGFETVAFCETESFQRALLRQHWPHVQQFTDIRSMNAHNADVITGGFPCQKFSTASRGRRVAQDLWPEMLRIVENSTPKYVIAENVSEYPICIAGEQLSKLGHSVTIRNISGVMCGAPHARSRWWAIAHPHAESEFQCAIDAEVAKLPALCEGLWTAQTYARTIRVSDGLPHRVHRTEALGNAVIPQIPQAIGAAVLAIREAPRTLLSGRETP